MFEGLLGERVLAQQQIVAALCDLADRVRASGSHPKRRMRRLRGRRFDDDVVELPEFAAVGERYFRHKGFGDDLDGLLEARLGLLQGYAEPGEFIVAIALADPEIEPAARQQIEGRGLLGKQN